MQSTVDSVVDPDGWMDPAKVPDYTYLINISWIRMDPELLPGSGTWKIQSWIRNKSFRIHNTDCR